MARSVYGRAYIPAGRDYGAVRSGNRSGTSRLALGTVKSNIMSILASFLAF